MHAGYLALAAYVGAVNFICFALMYLDKRLTGAHRRRISEAMLLFFAFVGGGPGGKIAQTTFRHKTRKQPFGMMLNVGAFISLLFVIVLLTQWGQDVLMAYIEQFS